MTVFLTLVKRNIKLFFKDKGLFFTSLITPAILLVLYATFLRNVYRDSLLSYLSNNIDVSSSIIDGIVSGELISSLLAVSCITVAFCSNFLMVQDKITGAINDFRISPVKSTTLSLSYYFANLITTLMICYSAFCLCLIYVAFSGWYLSAMDVLLLFLDVTLLVLFGNALSSVINFFLNSQGQISAVGTIVSSGYGFICGAYMPLSSFGEGLRNVLTFLPGTYGTSIIRNHAIRGALLEMKDNGIPTEAIKQIEDAMDCNLYFFENQVSIGTCYLILIVSIIVLVVAYTLLNIFLVKRKKK